MYNKNPLFQEISPNIESSIYLSHQFEKDIFMEDYWHFHRTYELVFLPFGKGKRYINDRISEYDNGDLVLLSPNTPHNTWFKEHIGDAFEQYVILFDFSQFSRFFSICKEFNPIYKLLENMNGGLAFYGATKDQAGTLIQEMKALKSFDKILKFFEIMNLMANSEEFEFLGASASSDMPKIHQGKIEYVNQYINRNFKNKLSSSEMAAKIGMTSSSFCRFYKKSTGKTFKKTLNTIRIQNACYLLKDTTISIENVALESGFTSIPLFYKFFNDIMKQKPVEYRNNTK